MHLRRLPALRGGLLGTRFQQAAVGDDGLGVAQAWPEGQHAVVLLRPAELRASVRGAADLLDAAHGAHALQHAAEDHVLEIQLGAGLRVEAAPHSWFGGLGEDEELTAVAVGPAVRHGEQAGGVVAEVEALILEGATVGLRFRGYSWRSRR